ncbi:Subtilisin-like protease [Lachnellula suecica]|uniref:Subtilisin-like protease n=1 Tax=Lachnellula suecica TaxID=602035 RepID=A0A8T9C720_9HELO|nr:Subtilisin-like protease [Lachnellula suecica]
MDPFIEQGEGIESSLDGQPPTKAFYIVFPKNGTEISKTSDFIKTVLNTEDISPWTEPQEPFISWNVEASPNEAAQLKGYADIDRVVELHPVTQPPTMTYDGNTNRVARDISDPAAEKFIDGSYAIIPRDGKDTAATNTTQHNLENIFGVDNLEPPLVFEGELAYWNVDNATDAQRDQAAKDPGVKGIEPIQEWTGASVLLPLPSTPAKVSNSKAKRAISYSTQKDAASELVAVSQPSTIPELKDLKDYVYEASDGKDSFVYHVESGVAYINQQNEFPNMASPADHLQTFLAIKRGWKPFQDQGLVDPNHSTCSAGKAVGMNYGAAKHAKLVVVQLGQLSGPELNTALVKIIDDISAKPERQKRSVVTMSLGGTIPRSNYIVQGMTKNLIKKLMDMDVPFFVPAGNFGAIGHPKVDAIPAVWASDDYPLLTIGSTTFDGKRSSFSQTGDQVFLYAAGEGISCMPRSGTQPATNLWGTSFSCPLVAGQVANMLSYDQVPFDTSDGKLVENLRDFLKEDAGSWSRRKDTDGKDLRMIWNGVTESNNPKIPTQPPSPPPQPPIPSLVCTGINNVKWMAADAIASKIPGFCADAAKQGVQDHDSGAVTRSYDGGTANDLSTSIEWPSGDSFRVSETDCNTYMEKILDGTSPPSPS